MAKQTFSVGQVLTAAQMTSLQETAMGGGAASSKTANYVLVAADAGKTISMTSTSATTITVNTGLFSAGDTVFIQNLGSATCTITAGTATVNTAGSLILPQYDAGILYFVSASSAIFYDYIQVGATSPLTTKGDLYTFSTSDTRLGVGANGTTLVADSAEATGLKWATPASGGMTLLSTTTLSGSETTISSISGSYTDLLIIVTNLWVNASGGTLNLRLNALTSISDYDDSASGASQVLIGTPGSSSSNPLVGRIVINRYASADARKFITTNSDQNTATTSRNAFVKTSSAITDVVIRMTSSVFNSGTVFIYGVK
jgi:hypothetical protein